MCSFLALELEALLGMMTEKKNRSLCLEASAKAYIFNSLLIDAETACSIN